MNTIHRVRRAALRLGLCWAICLSVGEFSRSPSRAEPIDERPTVTVDSTALTPRLRETVLGTKFLVRPAFDAAIESNVKAIRQRIREQRCQGRLVGYISVPISARGGGHTPTNISTALFVKERLEQKYGAKHFWALAPGAAENQLPKIDGASAGGGEYMYMWTQVLAGEKGDGADFDMVHFVGPADFRAFFGINKDQTDQLSAMESYIDRRAAGDEEFRAQIAEDPDRRREFVRYYGLRASTAFSNGALDEWNIFRLINARRSVGEQIAVYFDGRPVSPGEMQSPARVGYEQP